MQVRKMVKKTENAGLDVDQVAVVIDEHTGKVRARFQGLGATADAQSFLRQCRSPGVGNVKVDFLSSAKVVTGKEAEKAIRTGRL